MSRAVQAVKDPAGYPDFTRPVSITGYTITSLPIDIVAQTIAAIKVDITAQTLAQLNVNIAASAVTLEVDIVAQSVGNIAIDIAAQTLAQVNVNIAASAVTLNIAITSPVDAVTGYVQMDIVAQSVGNIAVDIAAQTLAQLNVNIAASAVTIDVNIAAQAVDLNIKTSGETNIVIDKLTQAAYTERRWRAENNGATPVMFTIDDVTYHGKFFPRGVRGFIRDMHIYAENPGAYEHYIYIHFAPYPGAGPVFSVTLTLAAGTSAGWQLRVIRRMWNYDSLFIFIIADVAGVVRVGRDTGEPFDNFDSTDLAVWVPGSYRYWIRCRLTGATVGDLPVSGTINAVRFPNTAARVEQGTWTASGETICKLEGMGESSLIIITCATDSTLWRGQVICDGEMVFNEQAISKYEEARLGFQVQRVAGGQSWFLIAIPFHFRRYVEIRGVETGNLFVGQIIANVIT